MSSGLATGKFIGMAKPNEKVHIIDKDVRRRAMIAYGLSSHNFKAQIYENLEEVANFPPRDGLLLVNDEFVEEEISSVIGVVAASPGRVPMIVFGEEPSTNNVVKAMLAGAVDYLEWPFDQNRFEQSIARAENGASAQMRAVERRQNALARLEALTEREREVLRHLIQGHSSKDIGMILAISPRTVEVHRASLIAKLGARSTSDAIRIGIYGGLDD
jgi:two-component system, LuxR family, response regulator FixJ